MLPLFERFPRLARQVAHEPLCHLPTPVQACSDGLAPAVGGLFVKRDDLSAPEYGGNKIRKLEFLLADARARGAVETLTYGYAGSNFAAATALYASRLNLRGISYLSPQKPAPYVLQNLLLGQSAGAELHHVRGAGRLAVLSATRRLRSRILNARPPAHIPVGGSSPLGVLGFVNAALELGAQVARGVMSRPDRIYIAMGSMGSAAGLTLGLRLLGWDTTRLVAVRAIDERTTNAAALLQLVRRSARYLQAREPDAFEKIEPELRAGLLGSRLWRTGRREARRTLERLGVEIRDEYYGGVYGETPASRSAIERARADADLILDPTYSGKAMAALLADIEAGVIERGRTTLFWATYNSRPLAPLININNNNDGACEPADLPAAFAEYAHVADSHFANSSGEASPPPEFASAAGTLERP